MRVVGMDIHRSFAQVAILEEGLSSWPVLLCFTGRPTRVGAHDSNDLTRPGCCGRIQCVLAQLDKAWSIRSS